jgi:trichohyalin
LETQRLQEEARLKAEEDARRKAEEEERKKLEELEKKRMESERKEKEALDKVIEAENLKRAMDVELKMDQVRLQKVEELQKTLPKKTRELNSLAQQRVNLKNEIAEGEKNLKVVKDNLAKEEKRLALNEKDLKESKQTLKDLDKDLKELDQLKNLYAEKEVHTKNLKDAREAIVDLKQQIKDAADEFKKAADEYHKVAGAGHIFVMKPEEYLQHIYNEAKAGREQMLQQQRAELTAQMKQIEDQIEVRNASKQKIEGEAKAWDYLPLIRGFRQKAQFMDKEDALKADLEKQYKELQKKDQQLLKDFNEGEVEYKKQALDFSPATLKETEAFLKAGLADAKAKYDAFQNAEKRETKLKNLLSDQEHARSKALREIEYLDSHIQGKPYDAKLHTRTQEVYNKLNQQVKEMPRQILNIKSDVNEKSKLVRDADFTLNQNKENLEKMDTRYINLRSEIDHDKAQLQNYTIVLQQHGVLPPQNQMQGQQPLVQPLAPKPPVVGGPNGM